jgi:uncharacterized OB-fold protein
VRVADRDLNHLFERRRVTTDYAKPLPRLDGPNRPFWEGARAGKLMLQRCLDCGTFRFPAARCCAHCRGENAEWMATSGRGTIQSFCLFHKVYFEGFAHEMPYNVIQVRLEEDVQLFSNLVGTANDAIQIGAAVEVRFEPATRDITLVKFALIEGAKESLP